MSANRPILVTGSHRSGTTWVGKMLALSGKVGYIHEPFNPEGVPGICNTDFRWFAHVTDENSDKYYDHIRNIINFRFNIVSALRMIGVSDKTPDSYSRSELRIVDNYSRFILHHINHSIPLIKDPIAFFAAEWLAKTFDSRVIILIRHPAAFASSLKRLGWKFQMSTFSGQPTLMDEYFHDLNEEIKSFDQDRADVIDCAALAWKCFYYTAVEYKNTHPDWIFIRHEDISADPVNHFRQLYAQLNLEITPEIEAEIIRNSRSGNPLEASPEDYQNIQIDSVKSIKTWKKRLIDEEVERIKNVTQSVSKLFYSDQEWK